MKRLPAILFVFLFFGVCCKPEPMDADEYPGMRKVTFVESDELFPNPERGFLTHLEYSGSVPASLPVTTPRANYVAGRTLLFTIYYLGSFMTSDISEEYLQGIRKNMAAIREGGNKCVLRFAYNRSYSENNHPWDASEEWVLRHIEQLSPILKEYADVIFLLEAGFIGTFGEWYYTDHFGFEPRTFSDYASRRRVLEAELKALPVSRQVAVRYPAAKLTMFGLNISDSLTIETAHNGSDISRIAAHNDCYMSSSNDVGTYRNLQERSYIYSESRYVIMGGETCANTDYGKCELTVLRSKDHHLTYLNKDYHLGLLNRWRTEGCMKEIDKNMGYRLVLKDAWLSKNPSPGSQMRVVIRINNVGYAAPMNPRNVELLFVSSGGSKYSVTLDSDPRFWFENRTVSVDASFDLPNGMTPGEYSLYLALPDPMPTLENDYRYSIRMANKDCWNRELGANLISKITIR